MFEGVGAFRSVVVIFSLVLISVYCGYRFGNYYHNYQKDLIEHQKIRLKNLYSQQADLSTQVNTLTVELEVERIASQRSVKLLKKMESEHYEVKKQIAFYEKVMAPEKQANGLALDTVLVFPTKSPHHYRFDVTLVQQQLRKQYAKGYIDIQVLGSLHNKPHTLSLSNISTLKRQDLSFSFKYFQVIDGEFTLPKGFAPERLSISATLPKGRWQDYKQINASYPWRVIIKHAK